MRTEFLGLVCWLALPIVVQGQSAAKPAIPVKVTVGDVTDNRSTGSFNSECTVQLKFTGDAAADASTIRQVHVTKAVDELGRDLVQTADARSMFSSFTSHLGQRSGALKADVKLRNPSRNASTIKLVEGNVEFFSPTTANGGVLVIKDILKHPAEPVQNATLKKYGVDLMYLTKESYEARKKQLAEQPNGGGAAGQAFGDLFSGMLGQMLSSDSKNTVTVYVKDPENRVVDLEFQDASGKELNSPQSWSMNGMHHKQFEAPPPADTQLLLHIATPEAIQSVPFKVENIPLP